MRESIINEEVDKLVTTIENTWVLHAISPSSTIRSPISSGIALRKLCLALRASPLNVDVRSAKRNVQGASAGEIDDIPM